MAKIIGVLASERIVAGLVEGNRVTGRVHVYPEPDSDAEGLQGVPAVEIAELIRRLIGLAAGGTKVDAVGVGFAGIIREGRVEESPNLQQVKGFRLQEILATLFERVLVLNDADAMAAGIAALVLLYWLSVKQDLATLEFVLRNGLLYIGIAIIVLFQSEIRQGCGGVGHLEGIMGNAGMRRRFLDMEPDEVFAEAKAGDQRCAEFVKRWHRALAAATATSIHLEGPGKFYLTGHNARFIDIERLNIDLQDMVRMSSLQGSLFEIVPTSDEIAIVGAAVSADRARFSL